MSELLAEPKRTLNREETLAVLQDPETFMHDKDHWEVKSTWLCDRLNEYEKTGYVYNAEAMRKIEAEERLPRFNDNNSALSLLIYNAQRYRRSDRLRQEGWSYLNPDMVKTAIAQKRKIEILGENVLYQTIKKLCRPVQNGDVYAVLLPQARTKGFLANGSRLARIA